MKLVSMILAVVAVSCLTACAQITPEQGRFTHAGAMSVEAGVRARCPHSPVEIGVLIGLRMAYDAALAPVMTEDQAAELKADREHTNAACGLTISLAPPAPPAQPAAVSPQI